METSGHRPHRPRRRLHLPVAVVLAMALGAGACAGGGDTADDAAPTSDTTTTTAAASTTTTAGDSSTTSAPSSSTTAAPTDTAPGVVLRTGSLAVGARTWRLGDDAADLIAALKVAFGRAAEVETIDCEAGRTDLHTWPDLTALVQEGKLDGWSVPPRSRRLRTDRGVGIGSTRRELVAAYPKAEIAESSLGTEWSVEEGEAFLSGLLESEAPGAAVTGLWSGNACVFR